MATIIGSFIARLGLDTNEYTAGILNANALNAAFGDTFNNFITNPIAGGIALFKDLTGSIFDAIDSQAGYAETIARISKETQISTDIIQALRQTLDDAGLSADAAETALDKLTLALGNARAEGGPAAAALKDIRLDPAQLKPGEEALTQILERLAAIEDAGERARLSQDLLGRSVGTALTTAIQTQGGSVRGLVENYRELNLVLEGRLIESSARFDDIMDETTNSIEGLKRVLVAEGIDSFVQNFGSGEQGARNFANAIKNELIPAVREVAGDLGAIASNIESIASNAEKVRAGLSIALNSFGAVKDVFSDPEDAINTITRAGKNSAADFFALFNRSNRR